MVGFQLPQAHIFATTVLLAIILGTLFYWQYRLAFAFAGLSFLLASNLIDVPHMIQFAGLDIILFLVGMMTLIGYLEEKYFFEYLVAKIEDFIGPRAFLLVGVLMVISACLAALIDEVTSILIMTSSLFHLLKRYKVNPIPFLLIIVFATNIGSSATVVGNPIGVMIAIRSQLGFMDFLRWATPITVLVLATSIPLCFLLFRKPLKDLQHKMAEKHEKSLHEVSHIPYKPAEIRLCFILFSVTIAMLIFHGQIEQLLGLVKNSMLIATSLIAAATSIFLSKEKARTFFMKHVDWWTLSFFMVLFASVGTLKYVGVTEQLAKLILTIGGDNLGLLFSSLSVAVGVLTAFMDNVLAVATFIPVLEDIQGLGVDIFPMWWGMLFSGTLFGNLTVIGSTANIVAMGQLEKEYGLHIRFMEWFKPGIVVGVITLALALGLLYLQFPLMPMGH